MSDATESTAVFVEAPARLHFGVLDLRQGDRRWFGGVGAAVPSPSVLVSATPADTLSFDGPDAERARQFGRRFLESSGLPLRAQVRILRTLPPHAGLGSGTQLALAVARALAEVHGSATETARLAAAVGRGERSAVGTWTFDGGGLVVEGGRARDAGPVGPLLSRVALPTNWRVVIAVPPTDAPVAGDGERAAFGKLTPPPEREVHEAAYLVLLRLLPAACEARLQEFGEALTALQELTGRWFAAVQGGPFATGIPASLVERLRRGGAAGVGQSSWGPAVYAITDEAGVASLVDVATRALDGSGTVFSGPFAPSGVRVWRALVEDPRPERSVDERP